MAIGIYKAIKRHGELTETPYVFSNNIQILLAVFAFCSFILSILWKPIWGWAHMLAQLSGVELFGFICACLGGVLFGGICIYSLIQLLRLLWRAVFRQTWHYNPEETPANVLAAVKPIKLSNEDVKQYTQALNRLIEQNNSLMKTNNKLIAEYEDIISRENQRRNSNEEMDSSRG